MGIKLRFSINSKSKMNKIQSTNKLVSREKFFLECHRRGVEVSNAKIFQLRRHDNDCGSSEIQIIRLTARIFHISRHLKNHGHDHATKRGLMLIIGKRSGLLRYLENYDRQKYLMICDELGIKKSLGIVN